MPLIKYEIIEHDGGWAYRVGDTISETYPSHDTARTAASAAAAEQTRPDETTGIEYEDEQGRWRSELSGGDDRPQTEVEG